MTTSPAAHSAAADAAIRSAISTLSGRTTAVLTGAGISTDSGIPDYRGPHSPQRTPMTIAEFRAAHAARQRYWARSHLGWSRVRNVRPNGGHHALAALQSAGQVSTIITQNVDGLHQAAGSNPVIDLHGRLDTVICLSCGTRTPRLDLQQRLDALNPTFARDTPAEIAPDGDVELTDTADFVIAPCLHCGGVLKPDVVFFGENVPAERVERSYRAVDAAEALLAIGTSMTVMSGFRFVRRAAERGIPIVIINQGPTRGDQLADVIVDAGCTPTLQYLAHHLPAA